MKNTDFITIKLSAPMVFPDLNQKENREPTYQREELMIKRLKFKTFREMSHLPNEKQIIFAITQLTGLSESDVDELYAEDAGLITKKILGFMEPFISVTKELLGDN